VIIAILSDVHGNLPALEKFLKSTKYIADTYICLGDVVNYGPWNDECLEFVHSLPGVVLLEGNHERLFLGVDEMIIGRYMQMPI
jgi:predicted phosphodiesterase